MPALRPDLAYGHFDSPVGALLLAGDGERLHLIGFPSGSRAKRPLPEWRHDQFLFAETCKQFAAYFAGELTRFRLSLHFGGTQFQIQVWQALCEIPFGATTTYGALAAGLGKPTASRAVGAANGANPLPIVVPCHRVVGSDRSLTGFGGGLETKRFLLAHEAKLSRGAGAPGGLPV
ncbi:MAG: methylated-DNA--[protein]-cysteine S-methyltransferase [Kiloniellales bacterium]|nr:methylated-DNA--[protein]-cysteine S-methyltransferase [Kiloniellales bacterium]